MILKLGGDKTRVRAGELHGKELWHRRGFAEGEGAMDGVMFMDSWHAKQKSLEIIHSAFNSLASLHPHPLGITSYVQGQ